MSIRFNEAEIQDPLERVFQPGTVIEVVFDIDGNAPLVLPTSILSCDYDAKQMVIYQTRPEILPSLKYRTMDITTLLEKELSRKMRVGLKCSLLRLLNNHRVSERLKENVILIKYFPPMRKVNLRTTYRLRTSYRYNVEGKLFSGDVIYTSGKDFLVNDISVTGIGLLVPKLVGKMRNRMLDISVGEKYNLELLLKEAKVDERGFKVSTSLEIARKKMSYNLKSGFIGAKFLELNSSDAEKLYKYIHNAQLHEIRYQKRL
ncbi:MAG: hypothetical protein JRH18_17920 [Deltaproteobacteria bacterium]|nr:hypothetical protein [Deltaproteobacteria bacterium]MBW2153535.1 hypothetical protein [Deltaproteobacteria bacterium]